MPDLSSAVSGAPLPDLEAWVGRERVSEDVLNPFAARALAATLDRDSEPFRSGAPLPPGWHWIYFNSAAKRSELGPDGHEKRGGFLPPIPLPRRMWAGGRLRFHVGLKLGEPATRISTIHSISAKEGRSGPLVFLTVRHQVANSRGEVAIEEEQDLVYRGGSSGSAPQPPQPPSDPDWRETFSADPVTLFRFSALTFNGHRIHYDRDYATRAEGYPGLVVHGPLLALLLLDAGTRREGAAPAAFGYRAISPLFCDEEFLLLGRHVGSPDRAAVGNGDEQGGTAAEARRTGPGGPEATAAGSTNLWAAHPERGVAMEARFDSRV